MSPGSNSSNNNPINNGGSPSSITSPIMAPMSQSASASSDLDNPGSGNEEQIMAAGPMSGSMAVPTSWAPPSDEERNSPDSVNGMSPTQNMSSPNNGNPNSSSLYSLLPSQTTLGHNATVLKSEISSPSGGSPGMLPSFPVNNASMSSLAVRSSGQQLQNYLSDSSIQHHHVQHPSVIANSSLWYGGVESEQSMHQMPHISHREMAESSYLK